MNVTFSVTPVSALATQKEVLVFVVSSIKAIASSLL